MSAIAGSTKRLVRVFQLGAIIIAASFLGALCNPPPPACNAPTCPSGQYLLAGKCVTPIQPGGACTGNLDSICASSPDGTPYSCADGTCQSGRGYGQVCYFDNDCSYDFSAGRPTRCSCPTADGIRRCGFYQREFGGCDSDAGGSGCTQCEPGLSCAGGVCIQTCTSDMDCPCDADGNPTASCRVVPDSTTARCVHCRTLGQSCDAQVNLCCNSDESCSPTTDTCCRNEGANCSGNADCCGTDACIGGKCQPCRKKSDSCSEDSNCCFGLGCAGGSCESVDGASCTSNADCVSGDCLCDICGAKPLGVGDQCGGGGTEVANCECQAGGAAECDGSCCMDKCQICTPPNSQAGDGKCCGGQYCDAEPGKSYGQCCPGQGKACSSDSDCCPHATCSNGQCTAPSLSNQPHPHCSNVPACVPLNEACSQTLPCCTGVCTNGKCQAAQSYHVAGFTTDKFTKIYDVTVAGQPVSIDIGTFAYAATANPNAFVVLNAATSAIVASTPLGAEPSSVNVVTTNANGEIDVAVGLQGLVKLYRVNAFQSTVTPVAGTTVAGNMVDLSSPTGVGDRVDVLTDQGELLDADLASGTVYNSVTLSAPGAGLIQGPGSTYVIVLTTSASGSALQKRNVGTFSALGAPIGIGPSSPFGFAASLQSQYAFVGISTSTGPEVDAYDQVSLLEAFHQNVNNGGSGVALGVDSTSGDLWIAAASPNKVYDLVASPGGALLHTFSLPGTPLDMAVGEPLEPAGDAGPFNPSGLVNVALAE